MFSVNENTPGGTAIDGPVTATDADGDTLTYSLLRTVDVPFATHFTIDAATGQLRNKKALDYEAGGTSRPNMLGIVVVADDGRGRTAQITVVVNVEDVDEPPDAPVDLTVEGSGTTSLLVTWTTPPNEGRPDIETYDVQYREAGAGPWTDGPQDVTGTEAIVRPVDAGKSYDVRVRATNDEGDGTTWALWGADGAVPVTIEARFARIGGGLEDLDFTLTRQGDTTEALVATVTIAQDQTWLGDSDLEHEVTFEAGEATADLTIAATKFSFAPTTAGGLTATVSGDGILGGEDTVQIVSTAAPPITVSLDMSAYTFAETDPAEDTAIYLVATLHRDYPEPPAPARDFDIAVSTESGTATFREDFVAIATVVDFLAGDYALVDGQYVARKNIGFAVVDDQVYEGSEDLVVKLEASPRLNRELVQILMPDGTAGDRYPVTVTDGEDVPVLSLSVDPSPIAEEDDDATPAVAENVSTVTVGITNGKTFAEDRTVTLTFSGATRGTHYSVSPADADTNAAGHQAALPAGDSSVEVTVTAAANDAAGGNRTLTVAGEFDEKVIGRRDITILDDDTTTANTDAEGAPAIGGTPQVGHDLMAMIGSIADTDGRPAIFPDDYDFQWLRVDASNDETPVGRNLGTYRPVAADVGSTIKVEVRFTDRAGNPEGPLASAAVGPVEPAAVCAVDLGGRTQIWTGTVTVGLLDAGGNPFAYGFGSGFGALDDTQFRVDPNGNGYTVDFAVVDASGTTTPGRLRFSLTGALAAADLAQLTLHVCGDAFALADATVESTVHTYSWPGAGLDWSSVTSRTLYLSVPTKTAPVVDNPLADQVATPGTAFSYRVPADTFSDADGDTLTYSATRDDGTALPSWLEFDDASRIFSGTPAVADIETVAVKVTASDGRGGSVSDTFDIAVALEACVLGGDVWCAILVVQNLSGGHRGCANGQTGKACSNPSRLTEDEFRHDGTDYDVTTVQVRTDGELRLSLCRDDPGAGGDCPARTRSREVTPRDLLTGSSFALTTGAEGIGGGLVSLWGRGAVSSFDGREGDLSLSGEVTGALLGADWTRDPGSGSGAGGWTTGLMMSHARGEGSYRGADSGKVSSTVTGLYPYGRYAVTDRVTVWGAAGYGVGTLTLTPEGGEALKTDMDLAMAAAGLRGVVVEAPPEGGPELAVKTDAMGVRTSSEATGGSAGGNLAAATADVTRLRLGLEGTWRGLEIGTGTLVPRLEIGVRHDGGDAETGFGLDLGGGLAWSDPATGIRAEVSGRGLLTHESAGFRERGIAGSFGWDPTPGSDRGPSLTLSQTMGVSARGGADALLGRTTLAGLAANDNGDEFERRRLELRLGYGFGALGDGFTATPEIGFGMSAGQRDYSLAWRLVRDRRRGDLGSLEFSLETRRRESANDDTPPEHTVGLRLTARW